MSSTHEITLAVRPRGKPISTLPDETSVALGDSAEELYKRLAAQTALSAHRLRVTKGSDGSLVPNSKDVTLDSTGLRDRSSIYLKDLGPQIAWRTVFVIEYLGPLLIHPLIYLLRRPIYGGGGDDGPSSRQTLCMLLVTLHFVKRELETVFVHRFSSATMPVGNIFKNSFHYWVLAGLNLAYWTYSPTASIARSASLAADYVVVYPAVALYVVAELANLSAHLSLRRLRRPGTTERGIPRGLGFDLVTSPNYLFEVLAWLAVWILSRSLSTAVFLVVAGAQMYVWARKKEVRYRREFGSKYAKKRYVMVPGLL